MKIIYKAPHISLSSGVGTLLAAQCLGFGLLALQTEHCFEKFFHRRAML
ncbi:MAG: hypothetical protein ACRENG_03410 [bacterium]